VEGVESDLEICSPDFAVVRTTALFASEVLHSFTLMPQKTYIFQRLFSCIDLLIAVDRTVSLDG
jgi:hypothetical protein